MRGYWLISGTVLLAGCSNEERAANSGTANINAAAAAAQGDIDTYAANMMEARAAPMTTVPKSARVRPSPKRAAIASAPPSETDVDGNQSAGLAGSAPRPCETAGSRVTTNQTRLSARADDTEFDRVDRDSPQQQAAAGVWREGDGAAVRTGRDTAEQSAGVGCAAK